MQHVKTKPALQRLTGEQRPAKIVNTAEVAQQDVCDVFGMLEKQSFWKQGFLKQTPTDMAI